jgi:hypothetical protein
VSIRADLAAKFRNDWRSHPVLRGVRVVCQESGLGDVKVPTVLIRQNRIGKAPAAPSSHWAVGMLATVVTKHTDPDNGANELDRLVPAILTYLDTRFMHDDAEAVAYANRLAYDIPCTILAPKE